MGLSMSPETRLYCNYYINANKYYFYVSFIVILFFLCCRYGSITGDRIFRFEFQDEINVSFITKLVRDIHRDYDEGMLVKGAILVFLPGWDTISAIDYNLTSETLNDYRDNPNYEDDLTVFCLHSQVDMSKQVKVFRPAEPGKRKVILSTNIAETSVTIEDVCYVIDCGKINVLRYFPLQKASNLNMEWISKSNGQQRAGRAGRVQEGICWHLYSRHREESLKKYMDPDIKRQQLEEVVLNIKVVYMPSKILKVTVGSRDLSQVEKSYYC